MADADLTLRIEHANGSVSELVVPTPTAIDEDAVTLATIAIERALDKVARCEARVFRSSWLDVLEELDRRDDKLFVEDSSGSDIFGGRLDDWQFDGSTVSVQIDSFERDALDAERPASFERTGMADDDIARDFLALVDAVEPATTAFEQTTSSIDYQATHLSPGSMLRELIGSTGAEIEYRPDGAVEYLERRGTNHTETLSPTNGTIVSDPRIRSNIREDVTHVRAVSQNDDTLYEEAVAVSDSDREVWEIDEVNSESSSRLQARATQLANEYESAPAYLEVETRLDVDALSTDPAIGDRYPVDLPAYGINQDLRIIELERSIDEDGERVDILLSNRKLTLAGR
jgi:hypothetical protein